MTLHRDQMVDRLRVLGTLGEGATSHVYLVSDASAGGALRAFKLLGVVGSSHRRRLIREAEVIARVRHPNIVSIHRVVQHAGLTGLVMDFVAGPTVHRWLQTTRPDVEECLAVAVGILHGLKEIHAHNLVHRDIKPSNIVLAATEDGMIVPRILDFGLVKDLDVDVPMTATGVSMGTPAYMAPEQVRDASRVDAKADLYGLGCVLFEMLTGERLLKRNDWWDAVRHVDNGGEADLARLPPGLPDAVVATLRAMLQTDPQRRPESAADAIIALTSPYPEGHPVRLGALSPQTAGGRVARGLALVQIDALRPDDLVEKDALTWTTPRPIPAGLPRRLGDPPTASQHSEPFADFTDDPDWDPSQRPRWRSAVTIAVALAVVSSTVLAGGLLILGPTEATPNAVQPKATAETQEHRLEGEPPEPGAEAVATSASPVGSPEPQLASADRGAPGRRNDEPRRPARSKPPTGAAPRPPEPQRDNGDAAPDAGPVWGSLGPASTEIAISAGATTVAKAPSQATVHVEGDAAAVRLIDESGAPVSVAGPVAPGRYRVEVRWQLGDAFVPSGEVLLQQGATTTISCKRAFFRCKA